MANHDNAPKTARFEEWLFCTDYLPGDCVMSGGKAYRALLQSSGKNPQDPLNSEYWKLFDCECPTVVRHEDLEEIQGGVPENVVDGIEAERYHLAKDAAEGVEAGNDLSAENPVATVADLPEIPPHNELEGIQGGKEGENGKEDERYHLSKDHADALWERRDTPFGGIEAACCGSGFCVAVGAAFAAANAPSGSNPLATMADLKPLKVDIEALEKRVDEHDGQIEEHGTRLDELLDALTWKGVV